MFAFEPYADPVAICDYREHLYEHPELTVAF